MTDNQSENDFETFLAREARVINACFAIMDYLEAVGVCGGANGFEEVKVIRGTINLLELAEAVVGPDEWARPGDTATATDWRPFIYETAKK